MNDFILECSPKQKKLAPLEKDSLKEVMQALRTHSKVAWFERFNTGATKIGDRFIRFGFKGCADILGQMRNGKFLAIEVKKQHGGKLSTEQEFFLAMVRQHGGIAFTARNLHDVLDNLKDE